MWKLFAHDNGILPKWNCEVSFYISIQLELQGGIYNNVLLHCSMWAEVGFVGILHHQSYRTVSNIWCTITNDSTKNCFPWNECYLDNDMQYHSCKVRMAEHNCTYIKYDEWFDGAKKMFWYETRKVKKNNVFPQKTPARMNLYLFCLASKN